MIKLPTDKIACEPIFDPDMTEGGIYIPDIAKERCDQGIVKYIGPDVNSIRPGDYIFFSGYVGTLFWLEDEGLLIILPEEFATCVVIPPPTIVPGVFYQDRDGEYFPATLETLTKIMADTVQNEDWHKKMEVKTTMPSKAEYEKWHS